jgi:hypothetical protein
LDTSIGMTLLYCSSAVVLAPGQNIHRESLYYSCILTMCLVELKSQVKEINHDSKQAKLVRTDVGWITKPKYVQSGQSNLVQARVLLTC